jgi:hypothetical protein
VAAKAGPIELPIILIRVLIPKEMPLNCLGVERIITFIAPTLVSDSPVEIIPRLVETNSSLEWNKNNPRKPAEVITVPRMIDLNDPSFDTM